MPRRPIRTFTAPMVITAACSSGPRPAHAPVPSPRDAAPEVATAAPDATPDALPPPMIVRGDGVNCFAVPTGEPIDCPPGGATIALPEHTRSRRGDVEVEIDESSMQCRREIYANPPYWKTIEHCPRNLLPHLTNGAVPTQVDADGTCWFGFTEVKCDSTPDAGHLAGPTLRAEIIQANAFDGGTELAFNRGSKDGVATGNHGFIDGLARSDFVVEKCGLRACYAKVALDKEAVVRSSMNVEVEYVPPDP